MKRIDTNLFNRLGVVEAPAHVGIPPPHVLTCVTAPRVHMSTIAGAAIALRPRSLDLGQVALELVGMGVGNLRPVTVETNFEDIMSDVALHLSTDIHYIKAENCLAVSVYGGGMGACGTHGSREHGGMRY